MSKQGKIKYFFFVILSLSYHFSAFSLKSDNTSFKTLETENLLSYNTDSTKTINNLKYAVSGGLSVIPGFGVGHALQGRYMEKGWLFTVGELLTLGGFLLMGPSFSVRWFEIEFTDDVIDILSFNFLVSVSLFVIFIGFKIWEAVDIWILPSNYKVGTKSFLIKPLVSYNQKDMFLGFSISYDF